VDSVTPDEPRRAPIRWHVATVRDARTESPTARTLVLDGVFDLAALEDLAVGQHADAHSTLLTPRRRSAEGGETGASCPTSSKQKTPHTVTYEGSQSSAAFRSRVLNPLAALSRRNGRTERPARLLHLGRWAQCAAPNPVHSAGSLGFAGETEG
jgi:hypothetical protein